MNANVLDESGKEVRYNSALLATPNNWGPRYDKMHRVPFGEYVPQLPFMNDFALTITRTASLSASTHALPSTTTISACSSATRTPTRCWPGIMPAPGDGPPVDFLVNISNDGWFDGSGEHEEHLAICRFRAIECRRSLVRAVNMGISRSSTATAESCLPKAALLTSVPAKKCSGTGTSSGRTIRLALARGGMGGVQEDGRRPQRHHSHRSADQRVCYSWRLVELDVLGGGACRARLASCQAAGDGQAQSRCPTWRLGSASLNNEPEAIPRSVNREPITRGVDSC